MSRHPQMPGQLLVSVLGKHQPGGQQDRLGIGAGRPQYADRAVRAAVGDDEPVIVG